MAVTSSENHNTSLTMGMEKSSTYGSGNNAESTNAYTNDAYVKDKDDQVSQNTQSNNTSPTKVLAQQNEKVPLMDFDDLLPHIGEFGRYQKILFLCMIPFAFFVAFIYFSQIFITLVPEQHWCDVPELRHLSVEER